MGAVFDAVAQYVYGAALGDFALQAGEEFVAGGGGVGQIKGFDEFGLGGAEEGCELSKIDSVVSGVVSSAALNPLLVVDAGCVAGDVLTFGGGAWPGHVGDDQAF